MPKKKAAKKKEPTTESTLKKWVEKVNKNFKNDPKSRPSKVEALQKKIGNIITKPAGGSDVIAVIRALCDSNHLAFDEKETPLYTY